MLKKSLVFMAALFFIVAIASYSQANVEIQQATAVVQEVQCVPVQVIQAQPIVVQSAPVVVQQAPIVVQQEVRAYRIETREKRPGLIARLRAARNAPKRKVERLVPIEQSVQVVQAAPPVCVGCSRE